MTAHPLDATRTRLGAIFTTFDFDTLPVLRSGWVTIVAAGDERRLADRLDALEARYGGRRDVAAAYIAMRYAGVTVPPLLATFLAEARVPLAETAVTSVRRHDRLELDRLAIGHHRFAALPDDPAVDHPDAVAVADRDALVDVLVETLHDLLGPFFHTLRPLAPFGRRGLWGLAADATGGTALALARETDRDHRPYWSDATTVLDRLAGRHFPVRNRPRPLVVSDGRRDVPYSIRGTCCLRYKSPDERDHHDPDFPAGYCHSCPLVDDTTLYRHYVQNARRRRDGA